MSCLRCHMDCMHWEYPHQCKSSLHTSLAEATWPHQQILPVCSAWGTKPKEPVSFVAPRVRPASWFQLSVRWFALCPSSVAREWHCPHHLPKERGSRLVTPRYSQAGNRTSSHHSHTLHSQTKISVLSTMTPIVFNATDSKSCALLLPQEDTQHVFSWHSCLVWLAVSPTTCGYGQLGLLVWGMLAIVTTGHVSVLNLHL